MLIHAAIAVDAQTNRHIFAAEGVCAPTSRSVLHFGTRKKVARNMTTFKDGKHSPTSQTYLIHSKCKVAFCKHFNDIKLFLLARVGGDTKQGDMTTLTTHVTAASTLKNNVLL